MLVSRAALTLALAILAGAVAFAIAEASERTPQSDRYWSWSSIG